MPGVRGADLPFERRARFEGGPLGVEGDEDEVAVFAAPRCMNCGIVRERLFANKGGLTYLHGHEPA